MGDRTILQKVYLCINGSPTCNKAGEYFIADYAMVKKKLNEEGEFDGWDVVIADAKLGQATDLSKNQAIANALETPFYLKSKANDINGNEFLELKVSETVSKSQNFLKIYSNGNGVFEAISTIMP